MKSDAKCTEWVVLGKLWITQGHWKWHH